MSEKLIMLGVSILTMLMILVMVLDANLTPAAAQASQAFEGKSLYDAADQYYPHEADASYVSDTHTKNITVKNCDGSH